MSLRRVGAAALLALVLVTTALRAGVLEDRGIEDAISSSYVFRELLIDRTMVRCYVRYGVVELRGQVADERERSLLTYFFSALPNVKQVDNLLFVDSDPRRGSARWQALRLRSQLLMLEGLQSSQTRVDVVGERWQLVGEFSDDASRQALAQRAHELAPGVPLTLTLGASAPAGPAKMDDASIVAIVRSALESSPDLALQEAGITCTRGRVTLRGYVRSVTEQNLARQLAAASRGVTAVDSLLALQP